MSARVTMTDCSKALLILALLPLLVNSCQNQQSAENERIRKEIIYVHDQAMEKIGYMYELETRLKAIEHQTDTLNKKQKVIEMAIGNLQQANRTMFDWMHQYQTLAVSKEISSDTRYRIEQLGKIEEVQRLTTKAITIAEELLDITAP